MQEPFHVVAAADGYVAVAFENSEPLVMVPIEPDAQPLRGPMTDGIAGETAGQIVVLSQGAIHYGRIGEDLVKGPVVSLNYLGVDISPDGETVAVFGEGGAFLVNVVSGEEQFIDVEATGTWTDSPRFSPDGRSLSVFVSGQGSEESRIVVVDIETGDTKTTEALPNEPGEPAAWSPDSRMLAYITGSPAVDANVLTTVDVETGTRRRLAVAGRTHGLTRSPEGDRIAYSAVTSGLWFACVIALGDGAITCFDSGIDFFDVHWSWTDDLIVGTSTSCGPDTCRDEDVGIWALDPDDGDAFQILRVNPHD